MKKEELKIENIKKDLSKASSENYARVSDKWFVGIILAPIAAVLCFFFVNRLLVIPLALIFAYSLYRYISEIRKIAKDSDNVYSVADRDDISVSVEKLSHITNETVHEPHNAGLHRHDTKTVRIYYFYSGISWREPETNKHYEWSKEYNLTPSGLYNTSVKDNEFYYITLKGASNSAYIYNTKFFELKDVKPKENTENV